MADAVVTVRPPTGGGGGAGNWTDDIEEATLDGDIALEEQSSAPSATADHTKLYAKLTTDDEILLRFNGDLTDEGGNSASTTITSANLTYATGKFGNAADFNGSAVAGSNTYVDFAGVGNDIGTGPYSIECWFYVDAFDAGGRSQIVNSHSGQSSYTTAGALNIGFYGGSIYVNQHTGSAWVQTIGVHGMSTGTWYHIAVCRDAVGTTRVFIGASGTSTLVATQTSTAGVSIGDAGHAWTLGRVMNDSTYPEYHLNGRIDEFQMTKTAKYTSTFTVPSAPTLGKFATLFALDGIGNETQLIL